MDNGKNKCVTYKIIVSGIVQGVGFRPLTFRIAKTHGIHGTVRNIGGMVEIIAQSSKEKIDDFLQDLKTSECEGCEILNIDIRRLDNMEPDNVKPGNAKLDNMKPDNVESDNAKPDNMELDNSTIMQYTEFKIMESTSTAEVSIIPPDLATCDRCREELYTKSNRRFKNPFISCMSCGPRYTIIEKLPYDRENTTMDDFAMCPACNEEYIQTTSRRFHAQTISCHDCGPYLIFDELNRADQNTVSDADNNADQNTVSAADNRADQNIISYADKNADMDHNINADTDMKISQSNDTICCNNDAFDKTVNIIKSGGIVAVKGVGGYHLVCSPFIEETVENLRLLKGREEKPFAVMFENIGSIEQYCQISETEKALLESKARPIVLLYSDNHKMAWSTYKGAIYCGSFLPYTPLQTMLLHECGPLIMTSANISNEPVIKDDERIVSWRNPLLNGVLYNKRRIIRSVDDSVTKVIDGKAQMIRRSRGYVPYPVFLPQSKCNLQIFAAGGDLKAAFCLYKNGNAVVSQYFGDLEEVAVMDEYKESVNDLSNLLKIKPDMAVCDMHPNYFSASYVKGLGIPVVYVQHHHAHVASVMAEHNLLGKVIGIAFDGTGYGTDGHIWGSEFMICERADFQRMGHLKYTPMIGGDQSMRDAKKTLTCFLLNNGLKEYINDERSAIIEGAINHSVNTVMSSSMGRLFDAVASMLGICDENKYEGECASKLEKEAVLADIYKVVPEKIAFNVYEDAGSIIIDAGPVLETICRLKNESTTGALALGFHYAVAEATLKACEIIRLNFAINQVALSGGVFANSVLMNRVLEVLRKNKFDVYYNISVPPNDGSISLGQTYIGLMR